MRVLLKLRKLLVYNTFIRRVLPVKTNYQFSYRVLFGKPFSYCEPIGFNAKIQWLKLNYHNPLLPQLTDKYSVRNFVSEKIGDEYLIPLIGVFSDIKEVNLESLPDRFILKATHGSGWNMISDDKSKLNKGKVNRQLRRWLKTNYYSTGKEWQYKNISPKIICEENLMPTDGNLLDIKLFCYNGSPEFIIAYPSRTNYRTIYTKNWKQLNCETSYKKGKAIKKPEQFDLLLELAGKLSHGFPFVRVDFLIQNERIYFGEMTFTPRSGLYLFNPPEFDLVFGEPLDLETINNSYSTQPSIITT